MCGNSVSLGMSPRLSWVRDEVLAPKPPHRAWGGGSGEKPDKPQQQSPCSVSWQANPPSRSKSHLEEAAQMAPGGLPANQAGSLRCYFKGQATKKEYPFMRIRVAGCA